MNRTKILRTALTIAAPLIAALGIALTVLIPTANASTLPWCRIDAMTVTLSHLVGQSGNVGVTLTARDDGPACTIRGYPSLGLVSNGQYTAPSVTDGPTWFRPSSRVRTIALRKGQSATAGIGWGDPGTGPSVSAAALVVQLRWSPVPIGSVTLAFPGGAASIWHGKMNVTAWTAPKKEK